MSSKSMRDSFDRLLIASTSARTQVRSNAARGRWRDSETDASRAAAYARRTTIRKRNGAETLQGDTVDLLSAAFLTEGASVRRTVGYVEVNLGNSSRTGTGFLIGPGVFMTNQHVIQNAQEALSATVTFDRELDPSRLQIASSTFRFDPEGLFLSSVAERLDFAVIALGDRISGDATPDELGFCPLSPESDKHVIGMNVNIIQHPQGNYKQVAIRNNLLTFRTNNALLYETDTEVGSSGSPVFNDNWDVVALHHYGQPFLAKLDLTDPQGFPANANEGVRASVIHAALKETSNAMTAVQLGLLVQVLNAYLTPSSGLPKGVPRPRATSKLPALEAPDTPADFKEELPTDFKLSPQGESSMQVTSNGSVGSPFTFTIPLEISIRLGSLPLVQADAVPPQGLPSPTAISRPAPRLTRGAEAAKVDRDYEARLGYNEDFLSSGRVPMPKPNTALAKQIAPLRAEEPRAKEGLLKYEHFSLILHKTRRVAIFTATNIDGDTFKNVDRETGLVNDAEGDTWFKDPRISESFYLGQSFYSSTSNYFDRGHLTRRTDPTWGDAKEAERANADTFHFTNCSPQHFRFNQSTKFWQGVERYILETGVLESGPESRLCVFQGPLYDDALDLWIDDEVQIPSSYWKVVVWSGALGLKAVGLVVDQLKLLSEERNKALPRPSEVARVDVSHWRMHIADIAKRTGLAFDLAIVKADTIGQPSQPQPGAEATQGVRIRDLRDIVL